MYKLSYIQSGQYTVEGFDSKEERDTRHAELAMSNSTANRDEKYLQLTTF